MAEIPRHPDTSESGPVPRVRPVGNRAWWVYALGIAVVALVVLMVALHLTGVIGPGSH